MPVTGLRGGEVAFLVMKWRSEAGKVTPSGIRGLPVACRVLFVPFSVGRGGNPVISGLPVPFKKIGSGKRPVLDALKLVVRFTVGMWKKPELGWVG